MRTDGRKKSLKIGWTISITLVPFYGGVVHDEGRIVNLQYATTNQRERQVGLLLTTTPTAAPLQAAIGQSRQVVASVAL